jgi:hypothetical protein
VVSPSNASAKRDRQAAVRASTRASGAAAARSAPASARRAALRRLRTVPTGTAQISAISS